MKQADVLGGDSGDAPEIPGAPLLTAPIASACIRRVQNSRHIRVRRDYGKTHPAEQKQSWAGVDVATGLNHDRFAIDYSRGEVLMESSDSEDGAADFDAGDSEDGQVDVW